MILAIEHCSKLLVRYLVLDVISLNHELGSLIIIPDRDPTEGWSLPHTGRHGGASSNLLG